LTADVVSAVETVPPLAASERATDHYDSIVIVGGGCYGSYYLRQLVRARNAGALSWDWITIVDRNIECAATQIPEYHAGRVSVADAEWTEFFDVYLDESVDFSGPPTRDAIVPSPLMPHLMYDWLLSRAKMRWPARSVVTRKFELPAEFPWQREVDDGTRYVSFATWMCPVNCVEPRTCPHTRGERNWSIPDALRSAMGGGKGNELKGPVIFHCTHRAYGVGMLDTADVVAADRFIAAECSNGGDVLIGTVSHCHGALNVLSVSS
jgi:hypothetical protein